jgi:hypothetical protein
MLNVDADVTATGTATAMADYPTQNYCLPDDPWREIKKGDPHDISHFSP